MHSVVCKLSHVWTHALHTAPFRQDFAQMEYELVRDIAPLMNVVPGDDAVHRLMLCFDLWAGSDAARSISYAAHLRTGMHVYLQAAAGLRNKAWT